jgi:hypothetical protein
MRIRRFRAPAAIAVALVYASRLSHASCGSAACFLVTHTEQGVADAGQFQVDMSFRYVDQSRKLDGSSSTSEVLVPKIDFETMTIEPDHHREISTRNSLLQLALGYGVTRRVTVFGVLPLLSEKDHEHFDDVGTPEEHFTNSDGTRGFGDVSVGVRYLFLTRPKDLLLGSFAVKAPTGAYKLLDSEGAINEPTIQPGTGSWDGIVALHYSHHAFPSPAEWFVAASQRINTRNPLEYRVGDETVVTGGINYGVGIKWEWTVQLNARHAGRDDFDGMGVPSTGSNALTLTPGIRFKTENGTDLYGLVQIPLYQDVNESQLAPRAGFVLGIAKSF